MSAFDMSAVRVVTTGLRFPEGPVVDADGTVLVVEIEAGVVSRIDPADGTRTVVATTGGGPNGAAFGPDGALYVCNNGGLSWDTVEGLLTPVNVAADNQGGTIHRIDLATGEVTDVFTHCDGQRITAVNDLVFDASGGAYVTDTGMGVLYYADPVAGTIRVAARDIEFPNGVGLAPDGSRVYTAGTYSGDVTRWDVTGPGELGNRAVHYSAGGGHGSDSMAVDGAGNVCVGTLGASRVVVVAPDGEVLEPFVTPEPDASVTNICFGGPDGDTAYITSSGRGVLYSVPWPWKGMRLNFAR